MANKIDKKIKRIQKEYSTYLHDKTGSKEFSPEFKMLQTDIFFLHDFLDVIVTMYIIVEIIKGSDMKIKKSSLLPTMKRLHLILEKIRFIDKVTVIKQLGCWPKEVINLMYWENKVRNEFAHTPGDSLMDKYEKDEAAKKRKLALLKKLYETLYKANYLLENQEAP